MLRGNPGRFFYDGFWKISRKKLLEIYRPNIRLRIIKTWQEKIHTIKS